MAGNPDALRPEYLERQLSHCLSQVRETDSDQLWQEIECIAQSLANCLRIREGPADIHTILGKTALPRSLTSLLSLSLHGSVIPEERYSSVVFEILRVAANLCMDHDDNRGHLLDAGLPQAVVSLLEGYVERLPPPPYTKPLGLSISHLKVIRTAIGTLLNASINYDAVKDRLRSLEAPTSILKLSAAIYPAGSWYSGFDELNFTTSSLDIWSTRCGLSNWAWRAISELKDTQDETLQIFTPDVLPFLVLSLSSYIPPFASKIDTFSQCDQTLIATLINADLDSLQEACMLIESLSLDVEDIRLSLARGFHFPAEHLGIPCLSIILDFIENGTYPRSWNVGFNDADRKRKCKTFDICKAALIKSVVEVAGEERNEDVLWDDLEEGKPGGAFVNRMVNWLKQHVNDMDIVSDNLEAQSAIDRDDMIICASLSLGNLARREKHSVALVSSPHSLAPVLTSRHLLSHSTDLKVKHGILALLKHLAQSPPRAHIVHHALGRAGVIQSIAASGVWDDKVDAMADVVQLSAIGVVKHMCSANVDHAYALVLPSGRSPATPTGLSQILALVKRTDSIPVRSEGSRVVVNVVKSLWSNNILASPSTSTTNSPIVPSVDKDEILEKQRKRNVAIRAVLTSECAWTLASLVGRSGKFPLLVNEGLVALSLLSTQKDGAALVSAAIRTPLLPEASVPSTESSSLLNSDLDPPSTSTSTDKSASNLPHRALDMLVFVLMNADTFPVEVRINVCSLLQQLGKNTSGEESDNIKDTIRPVLESLAGNVEPMQEKAIQRVLDSWA